MSKSQAQSFQRVQKTQDGFFLLANELKRFLAFFEVIRVQRLGDYLLCERMREIA